MICLVSGGADSTCLVLALRELGYVVSALHVDHGLRGAESDADARFCADVLGAEVVRAGGAGLSEAELRDLRYAQAPGQLRATGHTASDQVETILYRLVTSGNLKGIKARREDGVVRPLLPLWREETEAFCRERGARVPARLVERGDDARAHSRRDPAAARAAPSGRSREHPPLARDAPHDASCARRAPRRAGWVAANRLWQRVPGRSRVRPPLARARADPPRRRGAFGGWLIRSELPGLIVRGWRPGDRLAGRSKKIQDVFVDAKIPRSDREGWPLVVRGNEVVAVPGVVEADGIEAVRQA